MVGLMHGFKKSLSEHELLCLSMLDHPNINKAIDEEHLVHVHGDTLKERLDKVGTLTNEQVDTLVIPLLGALEHMHTMGVVHRDISPNNIMLSGDGPILIDFGNASYKGQNPIKSQGTVGCRPPVCFQPNEQYSAQDDLFALACTFYHALYFESYKANPQLEPVTWFNRDDEQMRPTPVCGIQWIDDCLCFDKSRRPQSAKSVLEEHFTPKDSSKSKSQWVAGGLGVVIGIFLGLLVAPQIQTTPKVNKTTMRPSQTTKTIQVENPETQAQLVSTIVENSALKTLLKSKIGQTKLVHKPRKKYVKAAYKQAKDSKPESKGNTNKTKGEDSEWTSVVYEGGRN